VFQHELMHAHNQVRCNQNYDTILQNKIFINIICLINTALSKLANQSANFLTPKSQYNHTRNILGSLHKKLCQLCTCLKVWVFVPAQHNTIVKHKHRVYRLLLLKHITSRPRPVRLQSKPMIGNLEKYTPTNRKDALMQVE